MLLGKGMPLQKEEDVKNRRPDEGKRHLAHNSYLQGFADMGLVGGTLLVGAFFTAGWSLLRCHPSRCLYVNVEAKTMHPYITASVAAYALGMATLSICFIVPTYMILALAVAYAHIARRSFLAGPAPLTLDVPLLARFAAVGFCTLAGIYAFVRVLA
jgi:hypothetical protein